MFFFIGGIQPKTIVVDREPVLCPSCGRLSAFYKRIDHYISIFFIPLIPVKKGDSFLFCESCGVQSDGAVTGHIYNNNPHSCKNCGMRVEADFMYCPFCGKLL